MDLFDLCCLGGICLILFAGGVAALLKVLIKGTLDCIKEIFS